jgi:hypothetical protein
MYRVCYRLKPVGFFFCVPFGISTGAQVLTGLLDMIFSDVMFKFVYHNLDDSRF